MSNIMFTRLQLNILKIPEQPEFQTFFHAQKIQNFLEKCHVAFFML